MLIVIGYPCVEREIIWGVKIHRKLVVVSSKWSVLLSLSNSLDLKSTLFEKTNSRHERGEIDLQCTVDTLLPT